jgi:DNA-binding NtrC family response regulator
MGKSVLVIDPEIYSRGFLHELLEKEGYSISTVEDISHLATLLEENAYDVVFVNFQACGKECRSLYRDIETTNPDTRIILVVTEGNREIVREAMDSGVYGCVRYPFNKDEVLTITKHVSRAK